MIKKEAFAEDDEQVLMIDPGMDTEEIFGDVKLPCEKVQRINNSTKSRVIPEEEQRLDRQRKPVQAGAIPAPKKLDFAQKAFKYPETPDPNAPKTVTPKPEKKVLTEMEKFEKAPATDVVPQLLQFDNIMGGMGVDIDNLLGSDLADDEDDYDDGDDMEEEFKEMRAKARR